MKMKRIILTTAIFCLFVPIISTAQEEKATQALAAIQAGNREPGTFYNAACYLVLAGKTDEALNCLGQAIERGYANVEHIKTDSDLISLHGDARWQQMLDKAAAKAVEQQKAFWNQKTFWDNPALNIAYKENLSDDEKIAGLSKLWSEAKYNFANFDLVPDLNWDATYLKFLPKVRATKSTLEYYLVLKEFFAKLKDGHTGILIPKNLVDQLNSAPLLKTRLIEDKVIVVNVYDDTLKQQGIVPGIELTEIDGQPVKQYAAQKIIPYLSASTKQDLEMQAYEYFLLTGSSKNPVNLTLQATDGNTVKKAMPRLTNKEYYARISNFLKKPFEYKVLPGNIAYVALNSFRNNEVSDQFAANFNEIAKSAALVIDMRYNGGGNTGPGSLILSYLTDKPFKTSGWYTRDCRPTFRAWGNAQSTYGESSGVFQPNGKNLYTKPVVVLTSANTYSAAEDFIVAYVTMKRGLVVGEPTGGSTGQPLIINSLPGDGAARICTKRDRFPDGTDFVGKGIQPDKLVHPTIADVRAGRDTVLEAALRELKTK